MKIQDSDPLSFSGSGLFLIRGYERHSRDPATGQYRSGKSYGNRRPNAVFHDRPFRFPQSSGNRHKFDRVELSADGLDDGSQSRLAQTACPDGGAQHF